MFRQLRLQERLRACATIDHGCRPTARAHFQLASRARKAVKRAAPRRSGEMQDRVLAQLQRALMIGAFVPGQRISLRKLAESFGTSAMPVREAINQLVAANVLEMLPNRTVCVPRMTASRFEELSRVRES